MKVRRREERMTNCCNVVKVGVVIRAEETLRPSKVRSWVVVV